MKTKQILAAVMAAAMLALTGCGGGMAQPASYATDASYDTPAVPGQAYPNQLEQERDPDAWRYRPTTETEAYDDSEETPFIKVESSPLSTFSADVDTASYSNMRRFIQQKRMPEGVRIEEMVNYFSYEYPHPNQEAAHPFGVTTEIAPCPWNQDNALAMIGVQASELQNNDIPNNIVLLLDVSGSMNQDNKLPLLKKSFKLILEKLTERDVISIITYAGSNQIVADSVPGNQRSQLTRMIETLSAGGSTAGADGLRTAYQLADKNYIEGGNNRIILATDGDFNVGQQTTAQLKSMIEKERERGVYISVLGFGMGNLKDNMMETIADCGNGNYAYIDTLAEAQKVLVDEFDATMYVVAKDLKLQVEFNPAVVKEYRLLGYNNRRLENEEFEDDTKDAGDVGAGHSVTAFYELVMANGEESQSSLKYRQPSPAQSSDFMTVQVRYKHPQSEESVLAAFPVTEIAYTQAPSKDFRFASAVAEFGLILGNSKFQGESSTANVLKRASASIGDDPYGLRREFCQLVQGYQTIAE